MSVLTEISIPWTRFFTQSKKPVFHQSHKTLQKLELTKSPSQKRGRWKRSKKGNTREMFRLKGEGPQLPRGFARHWGGPKYLGQG